jgi:hypothetical protein
VLVWVQKDISSQVLRRKIMKTVFAVFENNEAELALHALESSGFETRDISIVMLKTKLETYKRGGQSDGKHLEEVLKAGHLDTMTPPDLAERLTGAATISIPGIGLVSAIGPLATALAAASVHRGSTSGSGPNLDGLTDVLSGVGVHDQPAHIYSAGVRRGGVLVGIHTGEQDLEIAERIMLENHAAGPGARAQQDRSRGLDRFDSDAGMPISSDTASGNAKSVSEVRPDTSGDPGSGGAIDPVTGDDYAKSSKLGTATGAVSGAFTGALMGSAGGPIGTIIGGTIGAMVGGGLGAGLDATAKSEDEHSMTNSGNTQTTADTSGWHDRSINSDEAERNRNRDTTGLAGASLEDSAQGPLGTTPSDLPESTLEERLERAKLEADIRLRGGIH